MTAIRIDGKATALEVREEVRLEVAEISDADNRPGLAVILVGDDPASQIYVRSKGKACEKAGIFSETRKRPADITEEQLLKEIDELNNDPKIHGILVQLPLPKHIDEQKVIEAISPDKDVDGFHPYNVGRMMIGLSTFFPATPAGIVELLKRYKIETKGKHVVVIGRSNIVGKPIANMMVQKNETGNSLVTIVHSAAKDITPYVKQADILVAAVGRPEFITKDMLKEGVVVVDVGINRVEADTPKGYRVVGDVAYDEALEVASYITPVPGGVGPMTIAMLLKNTLKAYKQSSGK